MMIILPFVFHIISGLHPVNTTLVCKVDPCEEAKAGTAAATQFAKDSLFHFALLNIKASYASDQNEHCISFGKDAEGNLIASSISGGGAISGKVPVISNAFADLHNHPNNLPPDAGDFYGLIRMCKNNPAYKTRFVVTINENIYALLVTDISAALTFIEIHPPQLPAFADGPSGFSVGITDEAREMKFKYQCTDEMALAFILEKYNTGVCLLRLENSGHFKKLVTVVSYKGNEPVYSILNCR
ncbi:MAG: hypothetical protein JNM14_16055 [Ferruginibacter sp.]|nr:hypothetical protein [Ferruginibacter sp.]